MNWTLLKDGRPPYRSPRYLLLVAVHHAGFDVVLPAYYTPLDGVFSSILDRYGVMDDVYAWALMPDAPGIPESEPLPLDNLDEREK